MNTQPLTWQGSNQLTQFNSQVIFCAINAIYLFTYPFHISISDRCFKWVHNYLRSTAKCMLCLSLIESDVCSFICSRFIALLKYYTQSRLNLTECSKHPYNLNIQNFQTDLSDAKIWNPKLLVDDRFLGTILTVLEKWFPTRMPAPETRYEIQS